jgi:hypothetical protein
MLKRAIGKLVCAIAVAALATVAAQAADTKAGVEGKVVKVDAAKNTITISSKTGEQTYNVSAATTIVGPRGGLVHRRLHDPRFHEGLSITVVANGQAATQLILGVDHKAKPADAGTAATSKTGATTDRSSGFRGDGSTAKDEEGADEDTEFPGKVKSVDADKNTLTVTLLTGKDRTFPVGDAKITIGRRVSQKGLADPGFKAGVAVTIVTEAGGNKVSEVKIGNAGAGGRRRPMRPRLGINQ